MSSDTSSSRGASPSPPPVKKSSSGKKRKADQPEIEVDLALPEPPSKKAKRLLKKGKPLPPKQESDDDNEPAAKNDKDGNEEDKKAAAKKERSPFGVWIGNLRFTVTPNELRQWLVDNSGGSITHELITRVRLPSSKPKGKDKRPGGAAADGPQPGFENKGFAYVDFATYDANVAAIALSETEWYRRKLLIKDATNFEGRPKKEKPAEDGGDGGDGKKKPEEEEAASASKSRKVFVGNLGFQATEDDVRELFAPCGDIEWVKVATFEDSGKCKGYGWVKFADAAAADWAVTGFVKIKEVEETEEDFIDGDDEAETKKEEEEDSEDSSSSDSGSDTDSDDNDPSEKKSKNSAKKPVKTPAPEKKVKMRKWWVNTLHGRRLKIEHAEDDQTRYKKRYGKGASQRETGNGGVGGGKPQQAPPRHNNQKSNRRDDGPRQDERKPTTSKEPNFHADISVARLTGAAVKPEGKKITFD